MYKCIISIVSIFPNIAPGGSKRHLMSHNFSVLVIISTPCRFRRTNANVSGWLRSIFLESSWQTGNEPRFPPSSLPKFFTLLSARRSIRVEQENRITCMQAAGAAGKIGNQVFKMKLVCFSALPHNTTTLFPVLNPLARKMNLILLTQMTFEALSHK